MLGDSLQMQNDLIAIKQVTCNTLCWTPPASTEKNGEEMWSELLQRKGAAYGEIAVSTRYRMREHILNLLLGFWQLCLEPGLLRSQIHMHISLHALDAWGSWDLSRARYGMKCKLAFAHTRLPLLPVQRWRGSSCSVCYRLAKLGWQALSSPVVYVCTLLTKCRQ